MADFDQDQFNEIIDRLPMAVVPGMPEDVIALVKVKIAIREAEAAEQAASQPTEQPSGLVMVDMIKRDKARQATEDAYNNGSEVYEQLQNGGKIQLIQDYLNGATAPTPDSAGTTVITKDSPSVVADPAADPNALFNTFYNALPAAGDLRPSIIADPAMADLVSLARLKQAVKEAEGQVTSISTYEANATGTVDQAALTQAETARLEATARFREAYEQLRAQGKLGDVEQQIKTDQLTTWERVVRGTQITAEAANNVLETTASGVVATPGLVLDGGNWLLKKATGWGYDGSAAGASYNWLMDQLKAEDEGSWGWFIQRDKSANEERATQNLETGMNAALLLAGGVSLAKSLPQLLVRGSIVADAETATVAANLSKEATLPNAGARILASEIKADAVVADTVADVTAARTVAATDALAVEADAAVLSPVTKVETIVADATKGEKVLQPVAASDVVAAENVTADAAGIVRPVKAATAETVEAAVLEPVPPVNAVAAETADAAVLKPAPAQVVASDTGKAAEILSPVDDAAVLEAPALDASAALENIRTMAADVENAVVPAVKGVFTRAVQAVDETVPRLAAKFKGAANDAVAAAEETVPSTAKVAEETADAVVTADAATRPGVSLLQMRRILHSSDSLASKLEFLAQKGGSQAQMEKVLSRAVKVSDQDFTQIMSSAKLKEVAPAIQQEVLSVYGKTHMSNVFARVGENFSRSLSYLKSNPLHAALDGAGATVKFTAKTALDSLIHPGRTLKRVAIGGTTLVGVDDMLNDGKVTDAIEASVPGASIPLEGARVVNKVIDTGVDLGLNALGLGTPDAADDPLSPTDPAKPKKSNTGLFNQVAGMLPPQLGDVVRGLADGGLNLWNDDSNKPWILGLGGLLATSFLDDGPVKSLVNFACMIGIAYAVADKFGLIPDQFKDTVKETVGNMFSPQNEDEDRKKGLQQPLTALATPGM
jgi:hypothetical protein